MKALKSLVAVVLLVSLMTPVVSLAADAKSKTLKPYTLKTCVVSGDKLGEMGKPYAFVYQDQEIKLCCSGCKKDFDKNPAKYVAKIRAADKKAKN